MKVTADGNVCGTIVCNGETGKPLPVRAVTFQHAGGDPPKLLIELFGPKAVIDCDAAFQMIDPRTGLTKTVKRIVFSDGSIFEP